MVQEMILDVLHKAQEQCNVCFFGMQATDWDS